ncbi:MAG: hypothetical protein ACRDY1_04205 [Acidimicrobiales bacterium]
MSRSVRVVVRVVVGRPWLWPIAVTETLRLARPRWWRRWPPLPLPDEALWRFRMETAYGGTGDGEPDAADVEAFLRWSRDMRHWRRR